MAWLSRLDPTLFTNHHRAIDHSVLDILTASSCCGLDRPFGLADGDNNDGWLFALSGPGLREAATRLRSNIYVLA
jgi:hypothetical protein